MNINLICTGKTVSKYLALGIDEYCKRIVKYISFQVFYTKDIKLNHFATIDEFKKAEAARIFMHFKPTDYVILVDERGIEYSSIGFSNFIQQHLNKGTKTLAFVIGGAYGFSDELYQRANYKISLSQLTFSHQLVRLIFVEQLYRGLTILFNDPYHHE